MIEEKVTKENRLADAIDHFSNWPKAFCLQDFMDWSGQGVTASECYNFLKNDSRFIELTKSHLGNEIAFISELELFRWWLSLNLRISSLAVNKTVLTKSELSGTLGSLTGKMEWGEFNDKSVEYGQRFGFVFYNSLSSLYVFPLAHLLSYVQLYYESILDDLYHEISTLEKRNALLQSSFPDSLEMLYPGERTNFIFRSRHLVGKKMTLEQIGSKLGITRERVRQIEKTALSKIPRILVLKILLAEFIQKSGRLLIEASPINTSYARFMELVLGIPYVLLPRKKTLFLGLENPVEHTEFLPYLTDSKHSLLNEIKNRVPFLPMEDLNALEKIVRRYILKRMQKTERVYLALKRIGQPAHYTDVTRMHNQLFPGNKIDYKSTHATLTFCADEKVDKHGIVWVGMRGTYALKEWGYKKPKTSLFESVGNIVNRLYKKTGRPVSYNSILAEIGKVRRVVNSKSVLMVAHLHKDIEKLPDGFFIPSCKKESSADGISEPELDKIISSFREKQIKKESDRVIQDE